MAATSPAEATIDDLYKVKGKAELVDGRIVRVSPTGDMPGRASLAIGASLRQHQRTSGRGVAYADNVGVRVNLPRRKSFSPDAAYHTGQAWEHGSGGK